MALYTTRTKWRIRRGISPSYTKRIKMFLVRLGAKLGYKHMEDWYQIKRENIIKNGGSTFLQDFKNSPPLLVTHAFPEHEWLLWRFNRLPSGYWDKLMHDTKLQKKLLDWLCDQLSLTSLDDWYRVSLIQVQKWAPVKNPETLIQILEGVYPQHLWNRHSFSKLGKSTRATQRQLLAAIQQLFPTYSMFHSVLVCLSQFINISRQLILF